MSVPYRADPPDSQNVRLTLSDSNVAIDRWISYESTSDFLTPADSFSFTLGLDEKGLPDEQRNALKLGARCRLHVNDLILTDGRIDAIEVTADRSSGTQFHIRGRDRLGQTLDAVADPQFQLKSGGTLAELLKRLFAPFGWSSDDHFEIETSANRDAKSGKRGTPTTKGEVGLTKRGKARKGPRPLKSFVLHQTKPYNHESVFHFASRVAQRHGLWIWCSADGEKLMVGAPDFKQEPIFAIRRGSDGTGNVISGSVHFDLTDQPTIIMADTFTVGGSGEFGKGRSKAFAVNPMLGYADDGEYKPEVKALIAKYPGAIEQVLPGSSFPFRAENIPFRPMFLHDDESKTQEQLNFYVRREMSLLYRKALTASYTVEGHGQTVGDSFVAWTPDTTVEVHDDVAGLSEILYVLGVSFNKSRNGGTTTRLELVRLNSISFDVEDDSQKAAVAKPKPPPPKNRPVANEEFTTHRVTTVDRATRG